MYIADTFYDIKVNYNWVLTLIIYTNTKTKKKQENPPFIFILLEWKNEKKITNRKIIFNDKNKTLIAVA